MLINSPAERSLQRRVESVFQRCNNPNDKAYHNYGGRGIRCLFSSKQEMLQHLLSLHSAEDWTGYEVDRIDNNGHYGPENIRRVTSAQNLANRRHTVWVEYRGQRVVKNHLWHLLKTDHPGFSFGPAKVRTLLEQGMKPEDIPSYRRRGGRRSTTLEMPDPAIVSLYRDG